MEHYTTMFCALTHILVFGLLAKTTTAQGNTVQCEEELCGYQTECSQSGGCQCKSVFGGIGRTEGQPAVKYCLVSCSSRDCPDNTTCVTNTGGTSRCHCSQGYTRSPWGQCLDIDECEQADRCGEDSVCINTPGNFTCACQTGFVRREDKNTAECIDLDECSENKTICGENSLCTNGLGSYSCACAEGYKYESESSRICVNEGTEKNLCTSGSPKTQPHDSLPLAVGLAVGVTSLVWIVSIVVVVVIVKRIRGRSTQTSQNASIEDSTRRAKNVPTNYDTLQLPGDSQNNSDYSSLSVVTSSLY